MTHPHFISGLPRSGSTLLCALLRQNPQFHAAMTSPVASLFGSLLRAMSGGTEFAVFFDDAKRAEILKSIFDAYYRPDAAKELIFDTNRTWTGRAGLIANLYPGARIICCVRHVNWIIDSIERMLRKNPLQTSRIFQFKPGGSVYSRAEILMDLDKGLIGLAWATLREAWFSEQAERLIVVQYDTLASKPRETMTKLYQALGQPLFSHDFNHVVYDEPDYDAHLGMPGMHKIAEKVELAPRRSTLPPDLFHRYSQFSFWNKPELNTRKVIII